MAIISVLDPRCKFHVVNYCFPLMYKPDHVAKENVDMVMTSLDILYDEYVKFSKEEESSNVSGEVDNSDNTNNSSSNVPNSDILDLTKL